MVKFSQELFDTICDRLAEGESLRKITRDEDMPSQVTVFRWLDAEGNDALRKQYARAREAQADALFDDCLDIADKFDGKEMLEPEHINRAKLRIDTRKWMAGKLRPKKYGEKLDLNHGTQEGDPLQEFFKAVSDGSGRIGQAD